MRRAWRVDLAARHKVVQPSAHGRWISLLKGGIGQDWPHTDGPRRALYYIANPTSITWISNLALRVNTYANIVPFFNNPYLKTVLGRQSSKNKETEAQNSG
jgi:hypothetical protein